MVSITYEDIKFIKKQIKKALIIDKSKRSHHFKVELKKQCVKCVLPYPKDFRFYGIEHICQYGSILNYILKRQVKDKHRMTGQRNRGYIADDSDAQLISYYISLAPNRIDYDKRFNDYVKG